MFESPAMDDFGRFGPTFCVLPWIHMMTRPQGTTQPCCVSSSEILQESGVPFHLSESDPDEVWNSAFYRDIRKKMRSGEKVSSCRSCYESEAVGRISYRQESNAWWADRDKREIVRRVAESEKREFSVDSRPRSLDLRLGNHCNLSCRSCEPLSSSRIVAEWSEILEKNPEFSEFWDGKPYVWAGQEDRPATVWHREKRFLNYVRKTLPEVELL